MKCTACASSWCWSHIRCAFGISTTDEFLDRVLPIIEAYHGPDRDEKTITNLKQSRQLTEADRAALDQKLRNPGLGPSVPQYALPLFVTQLADPAICSLAFQRAVLKVRQHLDLFNQRAAQIQCRQAPSLTAKPSSLNGCASGLSPRIPVQRKNDSRHFF